MTEERWLPIAGYEGHYEVSDQGRVRSIKGGKARILRPCVSVLGYLSVLFSKPGTNHARKRTMVHTLVLEAFVSKRPKGMETCHYPDPNPANCTLDNLMWGTPKTNWAHRQELGHHYRGDQSKAAKLKEAQVRAIHGRYMAGELAKTLAAEFNIGPYTVVRIAHGQTWKHLGLPPVEYRSVRATP